MDILKAPKGTRDLFGPEMESFLQLEETARRVFHLYGFSEVRTPLFEQVDLFSRSLGETSDVVQKEMFTFVDRGERTFALRPEGTAGIVRHYIEHSLQAKGGLHRLYYAGPMFRAERPQAGRYRQFWQIGSEYLGPSDPGSDADTVLMVNQIFKEFGLSNFSIHVNSIGCKNCRPIYRKALLDYLKTKETELTEESRQRMNINPLRVLDSKADGPKLLDAPSMKEFLCAECKSHHAQFLSLLKTSKADYFENPKLVRGLDYYTRSVFEFVSPDLGAQSAIAAGGRYDELVENLGGPSVPGVGFALGMDRVVAARIAKGTTEPASKTKKAFVIPLDEQSFPMAFQVAQNLRQQSISVPPVVAGKKLKNQLSHAVEIGANWAILIGEDELKQGILTIKNLSSREQKQIKQSELKEFFKNA